MATPLEVQFSAIPGVTQMTSSSALGSTNLTLQFTLDKSIDTAAQEVQAAINTAAGKLPEDMPTPADLAQGQSGRQPGADPQRQLVPNARHRSSATWWKPCCPVRSVRSTVSARSTITGQQRPAIRVQVSADKLAAIGLTLADIRLAIQQTSLNLAKGGAVR